MDTSLFLQHLREESLEEGRTYIQAHTADLADLDAPGDLLADEALAQLYNPFVSLKLSELLIFFGEIAQDSYSHALGLKAKGDALVQIGHHQAAIESLDAAGGEFLSLGDEGNWARSRISWIVAATSLGRVEEALQEAARARDIFLRFGEYYWVCVIDSNTGVIYAQTGRYQDAIRVYEQTLVIYPTLTDQSVAFIKRSIAIAEANQALNFARLGKFEQAYRLLQQAHASFMALRETSLIINTEIHLAELHYIQGYYGSALRCYYQAQDILIQNNVDNPRLLAELQLQMANALVKLNRAYEACQLMNEAVGIYRQRGTSLQASNVLREYATALATSGRLQEAQAALNEASTLFQQGGFDYYASITKLQLAELLLEKGSVAEAYDEAHIIKEYFEAQGLVARSVRSGLVMVTSLIEQAQQAERRQEKEQRALLLQEAVVLCKQEISQARQYHLQEEVYKSQYLLGRLFAQQGDITKASRHYRAAIAQIERILDDLVYDLSPSFLQTAWIAYEEIIALYLQQGQAEQALNYLERARSMALRQYLNASKTQYDKHEEQEDSISSNVLQANSATVMQIQGGLSDWQERYRRYSALLAQIDISVSPAVERGIIEAELKQCETKLSELFERLYLHKAAAKLTPFVKKSERRNTTQLDLAQMRRRLLPDQLLLAYFLCKGRLVIFAITTEHLVTYENPDGMKQLNRLLPLLHAHLHPGGWPNPQQPPQQGVRQMLKKLYNLLIAPVAAFLPPSSGYLTIVPYGPLHTLPFHALYDGSHYLIENYLINYLPASSLLMRLDSPRGEQNGDSPEAEVTSKPPLIFGYSGQGHLQRAIEEARTVATMMGGHCYLEDEATITRFMQEAPGSPIIHIATHGHSRLDAPNFSSVLLADGRFNVIDAFSLDLKACELVTLSGCETGLALSSGGDEQLGLGRAFLAAGSGALVMSLWPVEDTATNELMQLFYQNLLSKETKAQALRAAQCAFIHRTTSIGTHPYYWAAFRLVGEVSPLKYQRETDAQKSGLSASQDQEVDVIVYTSSTARLIEGQGDKKP